MTPNEDRVERPARDLTDLDGMRRRGVTQRVTKDKPRLLKERAAPSLPLVTKKPASRER